MAARSADNARGIMVFVNVSAVVATPALTVKVQGQDPLSGTWYDILASAAIATTGFTVLRVFQGATAASNLTVNDVLPSLWRVIATHGDSDSITYSVSALTF